MKKKTTTSTYEVGQLVHCINEGRPGVIEYRKGDVIGVRSIEFHGRSYKKLSTLVPQSQSNLMPLLGKFDPLPQADLAADPLKQRMDSFRQQRVSFNQYVLYACVTSAVVAILFQVL